MNGNVNGDWTLGIGYCLGAEVRLHLCTPLLLLSSLLAADYGLMPPRLALVGNVVLLLSVVAHELVRGIVAHRVGGRTRRVVLAPTGGWSQPQLPDDPPAHLLTALAGPTVYLTLCVAGGCALTVFGSDRLVQLLTPFSPQFDLDASTWRMAAQLCVWINAVLLLANMIPVGHSDGAALLRAVLWPLVDRTTAATASTHLAVGAAVSTGILALWLKDMTVGASLPAWFPLSVLSLVLLYGSGISWSERRLQRSLEIDELDSDDDQWISGDWLEEDHAAVVVVEPLHEKQQETLDRKRREREDQEDAEVDHILMRLQEVTLAGLSEEERAVLKRASRRYRQRLGKNDQFTV